MAGIYRSGYHITGTDNWWSCMDIHQGIHNLPYRGQISARHTVENWTEYCPKKKQYRSLSHTATKPTSSPSPRPKRPGDVRGRLHQHLPPFLSYPFCARTCQDRKGAGENRNVPTSAYAVLHLLSRLPRRFLRRLLTTRGLWPAGQGRSVRAGPGPRDTPGWEFQPLPAAVVCTSTRGRRWAGIPVRGGTRPLSWGWSRGRTRVYGRWALCKPGRARARSSWPWPWPWPWS